MDYEIKIFSDIDPALKKDWENLELNSYNYCFQSYEWFENWVNNLRFNNQNYSLCIAVVKYKSKVICIFPFEIVEKFKLKILKWVGDNQSDYCSPILSKDYSFDKEKFNYLFQEVLKVIKNIDIVYLIKQPENIYGLKNPFVLFLNNHLDSKTYYILLPKKWEDYNNQILKKNFHIQNLRKKKSLKKIGNLKFKILNNKEEKIKILDKVFIQKNIRLTAKGTKDILKQHDLNFYKEFERKNLKNLKTQLSYLALDNEIMSIHWGIIYKKRFYYLLPSIKDSKFNKYSPGRLLVSLLIRWSISKKLEVFDFTLGEESYKKSWSNKDSYLYNYVKLNTLKGLYLFPLIKFKLFLKSFDKTNYLRKLLLTINAEALFVLKYFIYFSSLI